MGERVYVRSKLTGSVGYIDGNMVHFNGYCVGPYREQENTFDVTATEIVKFQEEEQRRIVAAQEQEKKESDLLALCGLTHSDFVRFRGVRREGDDLVVETRENGVSMRSVSAIRNIHYKSSEPDDFDSTYEYYRFSIPAQNSDSRTKET